MATSALNELTGMPSLPLTRGLQQPAKTPKGYLGAAEIGPVLSELGEAETKAQTKVGEADVAIEEAKRQEKGAEAEKKKLLYERLGSEARELPVRKALGEAREKFQEMAFVPTKETAQDLAAMFSLISVVGMVVGKGNAQLAMSAMNGMLEGHQKGKADLYKKEQIQFDKNFKAMQAKISTLEKQVTEAMELKQYDKEAGEQEINMALAQAESPLLKAMKDKQGDVAVLNAVRGVRKDVDTLVGLQNNLQKAADDRQDRKERAQQAADLRIALAGMKAKGGQTAALLQGRAENIREAFVQAGADIVNITKFPPDTMLGIFSGLTGASAEGMTSGIRNAIARGVTDKEQRMLETLLAGIEGHMAFALGGGYATSQSKARMDQYKAQIARAGDEPVMVPLMLARFRQEMNILADNFESKPGVTPAMNDAVQKANDSINQAVPFTVDDVLSAELGEKKSSAAALKPKGSGTKDDPIKLD